MSRPVFGFELLAAQAAHEARALVSQQEATALGDTPIEKLFFVAMQVACAFPFGHFCLALAARDGNVASIKERIKPNGFRETIIIEPQVEVSGWRVDFVVHAPDLDSDDPTAWRFVVVECDGHDFHERTKEQASRDRGRDRSALMQGIKVLRFTGSELWRDPLRCARDVIAALELPWRG